MRILAYDPAWSPAANAHGPELPMVAFAGLDELLEQSDFVSVHAPATPETRGMFNAARFRQMKPSAYFINTARGALVDESALVKALEDRAIAGAAIDVYTQEPLPADHFLRK